MVARNCAILCAMVLPTTAVLMVAAHSDAAKNVVAGGPRDDVDGGGRRDAGRTTAERPRDRRCEAPPLQIFSDDDDESSEFALDRAYAGWTAGRWYRMRPMAYVDNSAGRYRRVGPVTFARRRRPTVVRVFDGPGRGPTAAADAAGPQQYYDVPRRPTAVGWPYAGGQNALAANDGEWTADDVRRLLQRVFADGVAAGEAAQRDRKPTARR